MFVSHTREAGLDQARRLVNDLRERVGPDRVTGAGEHGGSGSSSAAELDGCEVLVAAIGPGWRASPDEFADEVERALARRIPVIPVVTPGASMPRREALPDAIRAMLNNHPRLTVEIASDFYWAVTVDHLARWLTAIATESQRREDRRRKATAACGKLEREIDRASERLAAAEAAVGAAEIERARLDTELQAATEALAVRQREVDPTRVSGGIRVFITYRPETSADARKLESDLRARLEHGRVFSSEPVPDGAEPAAVIRERIARCDALLAIIGPHWLTATGPDGKPWLEDPNDPIRLELTAGIERGVPVIPMLTQHASKPEPAALPEALRPLSELAPLELLVQFWNEALAAVIARLKEIEAQIRAQEAARDQAADLQRKLDREATRAAQQQVDTAAAVAAARGKLADLQQSLNTAREEQDQLAAEPDDENAAFRDGPPRDVGTTSNRQPGGSGQRLSGRSQREKTTLIVAAAVLVLILLIVII